MSTETQSSQVGGDLVTESEAGPYIGRPVRSMQQMRYRGEGPPYIKTGAAVRYSKRDLDAWLLEHRVEPRKVS